MRVFRSILVGVAVFLSLAGLAFAVSPIRIVVNGIELSPAVQARLIDGQIMVPLRVVAEALGADVRWEPNESCVYITTKAAGETASEPAPQPTEEKQVTVYITKSGSKYHRLGCRFLSKSCIPISLEDAKARGYAPCSVCNPPQ
ncbi:MAG TPA: copper amine oxidase N-terminal domain-containing protein [Firmicutes bacterium]|nr:copper amine oxidase N-terminal domain-containing protein [Bacillota bacterium]HHY47492.1 copper amine oxidase N-terminal domain-containing protein [Bacillota bacterium]